MLPIQPNLVLHAHNAVFSRIPNASRRNHLRLTLRLMSRRRAPTSRARGVFFVLWLALLACTVRSQNPADLRDYQKKAEFISSLTRFVEWPDRKFAQADSPFVIGIYGTDNISIFLQEAIQGRQIKGRPAVIKHLLNKQELRACHLLFISRSERDRLGPILGEVRRENVLTVSECDGFLARGGVINFVEVGGQVRFQVNMEAAGREKLTMSSKLLQLAAPWAQGISAVPPGVVKLSDPPN